MRIYLKLDHLGLSVVKFINPNIPKVTLYTKTGLAASSQACCSIVHIYDQILEFELEYVTMKD